MKHLNKEIKICHKTHKCMKDVLKNEIYSETQNSEEFKIKISKSKEAYKNNENLRKKFVEVKMDEVNFGIKTIGIRYAFYILIFLIPQSIIMYIFNSRGVISKNLVEVYSNTIDFWCINQSLHVYLTEMLIWNNKVKIWEEPDARPVISHLKKRMKNVILPRFEKSKEYNLANFTEIYRRDLSVKYFINI